MPQSPVSNKSGRTCPNCNAFVPQGNPRCSACKLEVRLMDAFAAAKKAAAAKGIRGIKESGREPPRETPFFLRPGVIALLLLVILGAAGVYRFTRPKPPRYLAFPGTPIESAKAFLTHISTGTDDGFIKAYNLLSESVRNPKASDEQADYRQIFNLMHQYLSGEFGDDWITQAKFAADPKAPDLVVVNVGLETLRIHTLQDTPADKKQEQGSHVGIASVDDFDIADAAEVRKMAAIMGVVGGIAGQGAVNNIQLVLGAGAANRHQPKMLMKIDLLAINRNPRTATWKSIIQMYPVREDPVVRARMKMITEDQRYDLGVREKAQKILTGRFDTDDPDLIAAGVPF